MSYYSVKIEITKNMVCLAKVLFSWLKNIPDSWVELVGFLSAYRSILRSTVVNWKLPNYAQYKCKSDGAVKGNPGPSSITFCIRNHQGDLIVAETRRIIGTTNLIAEIVVLRLGLEHCVKWHLLPVILETNSLSIQKFLTRQRDTP